jgi:TonB family protein
MSRPRMLPFALVFLAAGAAVADAQPLPTATGRVIEAGDGDVVVVPREARVTVVTRSQVHARLVYLAAQQTLLLLTDPAVRHNDGQPDAKGFFRWQVQQPWPLDPRWEGMATLDEYVPAHRGPSSLAIHTDRGTILVGPPHDAPVTLTPDPVAVVRSASASSFAALGSFDEIERAWLAGGDNAVSGRGPRAGVAVRALGGIPSGAPAAGPEPPAGAVRVGGSIRPPKRLHAVDPVYPADAQRARIQGVVILEIHIGSDGAVANARILRSIPALDQAALDAVRQWRYEPTLLNGVPVPVITTATVNFALQPPAR